MAEKNCFDMRKLFFRITLFSVSLSLFFFLFFLFFFLLAFFSLLFTVDRTGHAPWINISIYILSLSPEFYFAKGISKAFDLHTGHTYDQKKKKT